MRFSCEKSVLSHAVTAAARAVTTRSSIPALEGILVEVGNSTVTLTGYNLATGIRAVIDAPDAEPGAVVISAKLLSDILRKSDEDVMTVSADERLRVIITCGMSEFTLMGLASTDFPLLPEFENDLSLRLNQRTLKAMLNMTTFAVSDNDNKPIHTGALFDCRNGRLTVVAVDGYRLAMCRQAVETSGKDFKFVVPGSALKECERLLSDDEEDTVMLSLGSRHITFDLDSTVLVSRLLEGEFLNYETAIPQNAQFNMTVDTDGLRRVVESVSPMITERLKNPIRCLFGEGEVKVWCQTALGHAKNQLLCEGSGGDTEVGFNNRFLLDALRAVPDDTVRVEFSGPLSPCVLAPVEGDGYLLMVLPVRLK